LYTIITYNLIIIISLIKTSLCYYKFEVEEDVFENNCSPNKILFVGVGYFFTSMTCHHNDTCTTKGNS